MHNLTAKNAISSQDVMEGRCIQLTIHTEAGKSKREELEKNAQQNTDSVKYLWRPLHFNYKQFFRSAETFEGSARADQLRGTGYC